MSNGIIGQVFVFLKKFFLYTPVVIPTSGSSARVQRTRRAHRGAQSSGDRPASAIVYSHHRTEVFYIHIRFVGGESKTDRS